MRYRKRAADPDEEHVRRAPGDLSERNDNPGILDSQEEGASDTSPGTARPPGDDDAGGPPPCEVCGVPLPEGDHPDFTFACRACLALASRSSLRERWCGEEGCKGLGLKPEYCDICGVRLFCWGDIGLTHPGCVPHCVEPGCERPPLSLRSPRCSEHRRVHVRALTAARVRKFRAT